MTVALVFATTIGFASTGGTNEIHLNTSESSIDVFETSDFGVLKIELTEIDDLATLLEASIEEGTYRCVDLYYNGQWIGWVCGETAGDMIDSILALFF